MKGNITMFGPNISIIRNKRKYELLVTCKKAKPYPRKWGLIFRIYFKNKVIMKPLWLNRYSLWYIS